MLWKHFRRDQPEELARLTADFYRHYRLAAAKLMPDIPLLFSDFSLNSFSQVAHLRRLGAPELLGRVPEYLAAVRSCRAQLDPQDVLLATTFSPLGLVGLWATPASIAELGSGDRRVAHLVLQALGHFTSRVAELCLEAGADGVYYSCWGQDVLSPEQYAELGTPYDLAGLEGARGGEFRLLHVHGALDSGVERYREYPAQVVGWSEVESRLGLPEGAGLLPGQLVMGGIREVRGEDALLRDRQRALELRAALPQGWILAPGCSLPDDTTESTFTELRRLVE
ncbi:MAG: uroporphyrinogen decarboxylase family protein [Candidatus Dormibacteria bacterium]